MDVSVPRKAMICLESLPVRYDMAYVGLKFIKHLLGKDSCWSRVCAFEFVERPLADACITDTSFYYIQILIKPFRGPKSVTFLVIHICYRKYALVGNSTACR